MLTEKIAKLEERIRELEETGGSLDGLDGMYASSSAGSGSGGEDGMFGDGVGEFGSGGGGGGGGGEYGDYGCDVPVPLQTGLGLGNVDMMFDLWDPARAAGMQQSNAGTTLGYDHAQVHGHGGHGHGHLGGSPSHFPHPQQQHGTVRVGHSPPGGNSLYSSPASAFFALPSPSHPSGGPMTVAPEMNDMSTFGAGPSGTNVYGQGHLGLGVGVPSSSSSSTSSSSSSGGYGPQGRTSTRPQKLKWWECEEITPADREEL